MRILSVSNCPLNPNQGSGYVITGYARCLRDRGHDVVALEPSDYEWLPRLHVAKRLRMLCGYSAATLRALRRGKYDLVELWGAESWWIALRVARRPTRPLLVGRSNGLESYAMSVGRPRKQFAPRRIVANCFERWQDTEAAFRRVDLLTTVSSFDGRFAGEQRYQPPDRLLVLENPLLDQWLNQRFTKARPPVLGFFGTWIDRKGCDVLVAVLPPILRAFPDWRVRLVGIGERRAEEIFPSDVAGRIEVVPYVDDRARLRELYHETAVVMMPSRYESFGLVAAEAMACGCALVASRTGFADALKSGEEAMIVEGVESGAWVKALHGLLVDEPLRWRLARNGHYRVQSLNWADAGGRLDAFYQRHLNLHGLGS